MRNVIIETEVQYKLNDLKDYLISIQGERKGKNTFADIMSNIDNLEQFGDVGRNIKNILISTVSTTGIYYMFIRIILYSAKLNQS